MNEKSTPMRRDNIIRATAALFALLSSLPAIGQQSQSTPSPVRRASFDATVARDAPQIVRFGRRAARVGDEVEQTISLEMRLATSLRQGNELIERSDATALTNQRRLVATTEVGAGRTVAVLVRYLEATKQIAADDPAQPVGAADAAGGPGDSTASTTQPVQGKTYHCQREPGDEGKLIITDADGIIPPMDEYEIVAQNMEMVGRTNPLMQFLAGRTIAVGETVELPKELADGIFNLGDQFGQVTRFDLTLESAQTQDGARCAAFFARVEAASNDSSQMRLQVEGPLVVDIESCRAVRVALSGPIGMSETRGSYSTVCQLIGTGQLTMSIASAYHDAKR